VGVTVAGQGLSKSGQGGWDAGASTTASFSGDGTVQFTTAEASTYKMAGLTHAVTDSSYADIDYGVFLEADGSIGIFEDGTTRACFLAYRDDGGECVAFARRALARLPRRTWRSDGLR
jgi:hypothetical protein